MPNASLLARLPVEIIRDILEIAAWSDQATAAMLDRVSRTVRNWIGPILYHTVILHSPDAFIGFLELLRVVPLYATGITRDAAFYTQSVQYLSIANVRLPSHLIEPLEKICGNVKTLETDHHFVLPTDTRMCPRQLITSSISLISINFTDTIFYSNLTHLWFTVPCPLAVLAYPQQLVCLGLSLRTADLWLHAWLDSILSMARLQLLVVNLIEGHHYLSTVIREREDLSPDTVWRDIMNDHIDERIVIRQASTYLEDPAISRHTGESLWSQAVREGLRHPKFRSRPPIQYPDP